jgi:hypothetical protein
MPPQIESAKRAYQSHAVFKINGKRTVELTPTSLNHIYVGAGKNVNAPDSSGHVPYLTERGVDYTLSAHLYRWQDGKFHVGEEGKRAYDHHQSFGLTRAEWTNYNKSGAAPTIEAKLKSEIEEIVNTWVDANSGAMVEAEAVDLNNKIQRLESDESEALEKLVGIQVELNKVREQEYLLKTNQ